jgi:tRNA (guanosine-2'-O-)-methyltransferase
MSYEKELIAFLESYALPKRVETLRNVLNQRSRYLSFVLEDIYQAQNASAVLRSADCFGFQDVHVIENNHEYRINPDVEKGASSWLNLHRYDTQENNSLEAIRKLKADGYRIVATTPHTDDVNLEDFDLTKGKAAIIFGTEVTGISDIVREEADEFLKIPMYGFTESFNISVSAAIVMHHLRLKLINSEIDWQLSEAESDTIMLKWLNNTIKSSQDLIKRFEKEYKLK